MLAGKFFCKTYNYECFKDGFRFVYKTFLDLLYPSIFSIGAANIDPFIHHIDSFILFYCSTYVGSEF